MMNHLTNRTKALLLGALATLAVVIVIILALGAFADVGPASNSKDISEITANQPVEPAPQPAVTDPGNQAAANSNTTITVAATGFSPADVTIAKGTTLTWVNKDTKEHAVDTPGNGQGPHSPKLAPNESFSYSFQQPGTFQYIDAFNDAHKATVIVTPGE